MDANEKFAEEHWAECLSFARNGERLEIQINKIFFFLKKFSCYLKPLMMIGPRLFLLLNFFSLYTFSSACLSHCRPLVISLALLEWKATLPIPAYLNLVYSLGSG